MKNKTPQMNKKPTQNNLLHFTRNMYLVTYEQLSKQGVGNKKFGIVQVFNKPQAAHKCLEKLLKQQNELPFYDRGYIQYKLQTVDLKNPLTTQLFEYNY